ncbi:hypothetical protein ACIG54_07710 [Streptomyces achromogenes]
MTSTWMVIHSHSLYRFTVMRLMVHVALAFGAATADVPACWPSD